MACIGVFKTELYIRQQFLYIGLGRLLCIYDIGLQPDSDLYNHGYSNGKLWEEYIQWRKNDVGK